MLTALLFGLTLFRTLLQRFFSKPWRVPVLPIYAMSGTVIAISFILSWAHWPTPVNPLDINGLLLSQSDAANLIAWSDEISTESLSPDIDIPPELYPESDPTFDPQAIASISLPWKDTNSGNTPAEMIASITPLDQEPQANEPPKIIRPPANGIYHIVRRGETLWDIAKAYGAQCDLVEGYNPHINPRSMQLGQKVFIPGADAVQIVPRKTKMILPITSSWLISGFGMRKHPLGGVLRFHRGIDLPADIGTPVRAVMDGVVTEAGWRNSLGRYVKIKHSGGFETVYGHNSKIDVKVGTRVTEGRIISHSGSTGRSTGPHLHFEVIKNGKHVDPEQYLPRLSHTRSTSRLARNK